MSEAKVPSSQQRMENKTYPTNAAKEKNAVKVDALIPMVLVLPAAKSEAPYYACESDPLKLLSAKFGIQTLARGAPKEVQYTYLVISPTLTLHHRVARPAEKANEHVSAALTSYYVPGPAVICADDANGDAVDVPSNLLVQLPAIFRADLEQRAKYRREMAAHGFEVFQL